MSEPAKKIATYEDLYNIPENTTGEIINGELIVTPRPAPQHMNVPTNLSMRVGPPYRFGEGGPGGWVFLFETEVKLGEDLLVPDLAGWKAERFKREKDCNWISVAPDWVCEILSPSTTLRDRREKMQIYAEHGVGYCWLIHPVDMTLEVYRLGSNGWTPLGVFGGEEKVRVKPFQEIEINLADLWLK